MDNLGTLGTTDAQIELMDVATNFCRNKSPIDKVRGLIEDDTGYDPAIWQEVAELGWLAIAIPEQHGGVGLSITETVPIAEQMGRNLMATPFTPTIIAAQALVTGGSDALQSAWLPKIAEGFVATLALSEDNGDWDLNNISASGQIDDDHVTLSGTKLLVLYGMQAAVIITSLKIDGQLRIAAIDRGLLNDDAFRREKIIDETSRSYAINLDGLRIPSDALFSADMTRRTLERIELCNSLLHSAEMAGGNQAVIDYTIDYLQTRKQFGKTIGGYQALKHPTVDNYVEYEKARTHLYSAAYCIDEQGRGEVAVHMATAQTHSAYSIAADRAIQFHGAFGFTHDCDAHLYRRQAIFKGALIGDADHHRAKLSGLLFD